MAMGLGSSTDMVENFKVICVTPAGRRKYMTILSKYVRKAMTQIVDEWHLWQNTGIPDDIEYLEELRGLDPTRIKIIKTEDPHHFCSGRIRSFFPYACGLDAIYVRFDDDVVYLEDGAIERLVRYRIEHPEYFLIGGNIVNNPVCAHRQQKVGALFSSKPITDHFLDGVALSMHGDIGAETHRQFLATEDKTKWHFPSEALRPSMRFGIQMISWFGSEFKKFDGVLPHLDEENWLTIERPDAIGKVNALCGDALCAHFAYTEQRKGMDSTGLLEQYAALAEKI